MHSGKIAKVVLSVTLMLFYTFAPEFAAAEATLLREVQKTELSIAFSTNIARPDRYKLEIFRETIALGESTGWDGQALYLADMDQSENRRDTTKAGLADSTYKYRRPMAVFLVAFVPGFLIHGLGHAYIGKGNTAWLLFGIEVISFGLALVAIGYGFHRMDGGSSGDTPDPEPWTLASTALFVSSWIYDCAASPAKAAKMNQQAELERGSKTTISIGAGIKDTQARLVISLRW